MATFVYIDHDPLWTGAVANITSSAHGVLHLGSSSTATDALALCGRMGPDVVLVDLVLPDMDGLEFINRLSGIRPAPKVVIFARQISQALLYLASRARIAGLLIKSAQILNRLPTILPKVTMGAQAIEPDVRQMITQMRQQPDAFFKLLSPAELRLLPLFGSGLSDAQIADAMDIRRFSVKSHRNHILAKLNLHRSADLVRWCVEHGFAAYPKLPSCSRAAAFEAEIEALK